MLKKTSSMPDHPAAPSRRCRVCRSSATEMFASIGERDYRRCLRCEAVVLDADGLPSREEEQAHYRHHENDPDDPRYRRFLSKLCDPLAARLKPASLGLDYGCGPGPALAAMLRERGHEMRLYDPFFAPDPSALAVTYDFIVCSEVAEHFHEPAVEFERLDRLLKPGGWLGLMTCFRTEDARFANWHYRRDPTHVVFYKEETIHHLARRFGWQCVIPVKDVALLRKAV
ncbi:class I SAM-dependent methyltransferase [Nitratireductor sp. GCM10026969]|uniref:class I SAM-dependent methyltransferase n=1 Tax=Nitratireductor sp. GCM10026969 TaxID=3252645 RepID=UPI0036145B2A